MTDQTIPADVTPEDMEHARSYVRDFLDSMHANDRTLAVARVLDALLPDPPRPTLADIPPEERDKCKWMQADTANGARVTILRLWNGLARVVNKRGFVLTYEYAEVTPRPDLPRMTWPGDTSEPDEEGDTND